MTDNPLTRASPINRTFDLDDFCDASNKLNWVRHSGRPYFICTKRDDSGNIVYDDKTGRPVRYLDRNG